jgi:hypothetical protein
MIKRKYTPECFGDEEYISDMLNEEPDIDSDDEMALENGGESASENRAPKCRKVRVRVKQVLCVLMGGMT